MQPTRRSIFFCLACIERATSPEHSLLDPIGNHGANVSQVFAYLLNLVHCLHQKLQVGIQFAHWPIPVLMVEIGTAAKAVDVYVWRALTVAINTSITLLQAIGVPGNLVVNKERTVILQVDTSVSGVGAE